jgi:hypothetical protein
MANVLKHRFASAKADGADATQVQPSHWNDGHLFTGGNAGDVLTRDPSDATFGATWAAANKTVLTWPVQWSVYGGDAGLFLGNGTITGRYTKDGQRVTMTLLVVGGTTTNFGSVAAFYLFTLPVPSIDSREVNMVGSIWSTAGVVVPALGLGALDTTHINIVNMSGQPIGPTLPGSWWGPNAKIVISGTYFTT